MCGRDLARAGDRGSPATDIPGLGAGGPAGDFLPSHPVSSDIWTNVTVSVTDLFYWVVFVVFF